MLSQLIIRDILLFEHLALDFDEGLNVFTGETGAGKSILLDCLGLALGWRGRADIVRSGASEGRVEALFTLPKDHKVFGILSEAGISAEDEVILRRIVKLDGRKRGFVNDQPVSTEFLNDIGAALVELHGQHDDKGLMNEKSHIQLLDRFAQNDLSPMKTYFQSYKLAETALMNFEDAYEAARKESDFIEHAATELSALDVQFGEVESLEEKRRFMQKGAKVSGRLSALLQNFGSDGVVSHIGGMLKETESLVQDLGDVAEPAYQALELAFEQLSQAEDGLERIAEILDFDPFALEMLEERLFAIRAAARKYQVEPDKLSALAEEFLIKRDAFGNSDAEREKLHKARDEAINAAHQEAEQLHKIRDKAAREIAQSMSEELAPLKMENASFSVEITPSTLSSSGLDKVRFVVQTNPGAPAGPLSRIASGGELSRFLLALKLCLHEDEDKMLIFDEIDRGVGGSTADAVGARLARLSQDTQSLVVTHSPQVSSKARRHFLIAKTQSEHSTSTQVRALSHEERIDEIARMISGEFITEEAKAAAAKLIEN